MDNKIEAAIWRGLTVVPVFCIRGSGACELQRMANIWQHVIKLSLDIRRGCLIHFCICCMSCTNAICSMCGDALQKSEDLGPYSYPNS